MKQEGAFIAPKARQYKHVFMLDNSVLRHQLPKIDTLQRSFHTNVVVLVKKRAGCDLVVQP